MKEGKNKRWEYTQADKARKGCMKCSKTNARIPKGKHGRTLALPQGGAAFLRKRLLPLWRHNQWLIITGLWLITVCLGFIGFAKNQAMLNKGGSFWDIFYLTLQLFVMQSGDVAPMPWELDFARFVAPFVTAFTALQAAALIFHQQVQKLFLYFLSDHVVICGLGRKAELIAEEFRREGRQVVIIEKDSRNCTIERCVEEDMTVLAGDSAAFSDALALYNRLRSFDVTIVVVTRRASGLSALIGGREAGFVINRRNDPTIKPQ